MKRILSAFLLLICSVSVFSQENKYRKLLENKGFIESENKMLIEFARDEFQRLTDSSDIYYSQFSFKEEGIRYIYFTFYSTEKEFNEAVKDEYKPIIVFFILAGYKANKNGVETLVTYYKINSKLLPSRNKIWLDRDHDFKESPFEFFYVWY